MMDHTEDIEDLLAERKELSYARICEIAEEGIGKEPFSDFFKTTAKQILAIKKPSEDAGLEELRAHNRRLYEDILPEQYENSYRNPDVACRKLGAFGPYLSFLSSELMGLICYVYEGRTEEEVIFLELFVQCACLFDADEATPQALEHLIYWFYHDYSEIFTEQNIRSNLDPDFSFATDIIMKSDPDDLRYLYRYGDYISETEEQVAAFLKTFSDEEIQKMADTFTEGYRKGFELAGIDLSKKETVNIRYPIGFERVIRQAILNFEKLGLRPTIYRCAPTAFLRRGTLKIGYTSQSPNAQYEFDHANDQSLYLDNALAKRRLETIRVSYEEHKQQAAVFAGPAVMEVFGEEPFVPQMKQTTTQFDEKQQKIRVEMAAKSGEITNEYIRGDERSFTIIAYPIPSIGEDFEEIFRRTAQINTLDYEKYQTIQQHLIDALDQGTSVHVLGTNGNETDIIVQLYRLQNPDEETIFENCVADVNIPVGEVFTSPVLEGTNGILHVSKVYLNGLEYRDLRIEIKDGMACEYTLANFDDSLENKRYFKTNVLYDHDMLPIGEFAIGTNTAAYRMGRDFGITDKLPILIAEKTGPHFALGDTCYSHQEDMVTRNPDGKKIVARDNSISLKRKEDPLGAYFNCHTDITLPFDELGLIEVICSDGSRIDLIRDGRFVLPGTEELNQSLI